MVRLMNSAMMPAPGTYKLTSISRQAFATMLIEAAHANQLASYIGYRQNADIIEKMTGLRVPIVNDRTPVEDGDTMLCMTLKYRKGRNKGAPVNEHDFEYFLATYRASK